MAETVELKAERKTATGSAAAKKLRKTDAIPAIVYGGTKTPEMITLQRKALWKEVESGTFMSTVYTLDVAGKKERVIPRNVQLDPVRDFLVHVDFLRVSRTSRIDVEVPVTFVGEEESPGLNRGGTMNVVRYTIELNCPAEEIPDTIEIDVSGLDIGDSVHISAVKLPESATPTITDRDFTIASIAAPSALKSEEDEDEDGTEEEAEDQPESPESEDGEK